MTGPAAFIAQAIADNCERHFAGLTDRATWERNQSRLWDLAIAHHCRDAVVTLVDPLRTVGKR
jgi:hypothetical protein